MGTGQPRWYISHCPRHLSNKTGDSKRCYRSRELSQDCDQETRAASHGQDSTCLEGLQRYSRNVVKDSARPFTSQKSKTPEQLPPHKAKHVSSPPAQQKSVGGKKKREAAQFLLPSKNCVSSKCLIPLCWAQACGCSGDCKAEPAKFLKCKANALPARCLWPLREERSPMHSPQQPSLGVVLLPAAGHCITADLFSQPSIMKFAFLLE